ncbi:MAG: Dyp-type peroxidase [Burkholderiaceae bacterium]|nr:Dyp-type peroxidase [Burkholderiaceae bacterium]
MSLFQPGILAPIPAHARYLSLGLRPGVDPRPALRTLAREADGLHCVAGIGASLAAALGASIDGLREPEVPAGARVALPVTPAALWLWLRGDEPGALLLAGRHWAGKLAPAFELQQSLVAFRHEDGRDLTGYEDGTENPQGQAALSTAFVQGRGAGRDGASFVAVQQWQHALERFEALSTEAQDHAIGRRRSDNEELDDAPPSAHVQRTAQESFDPEAFVLRRSMPWHDGRDCGLLFAAFGASLDAFEAQLRRMSGAEDGITDALFGFTRPLTGAAFWCPPRRPGGGLDLRALGLSD